MAKTTRRDFIKTGAGAVGAGLMLPVINRQAMGATVVERLRDELVAENRILVIVELAGGDDPLNTIVPLRQYDIYASFRTRIAIPKDKALPLYGSTTMGLTPDLSALKPVIDAGKVAVIQNAHYPNPNLSHEDSRLVYYLGDPAGRRAFSKLGWIGRHSVLFGNRNNSLDTVGVSGVSPTLSAPGAKVVGVNADANGNANGYSFYADTVYAGDRNNKIAAARVMDSSISPKPYQELVETTTLDAFNSADQMAAATAAYQSSIQYPANSFANGLKLIAKLASSTNPALGTRVFYISIGGFDTHAAQVTDQTALHLTVGEGLKAFHDDLVAHNIADRTLIMAWSEFGRRVADNASDGTDHGTGNNIYFIGNRVKGGVYGPDPNLTNLQNGNLAPSQDFRAAYQTVIESWFGNTQGEAAQILGGNFGNLGCLM